MKTHNTNFGIGDIVGNTVQGFDFEVIDMEDSLHGLIIKNILTGEIRKTTYQNMRKKGF